MFSFPLAPFKRWRQWNNHGWRSTQNYEGNPIVSSTQLNYLMRDNWWYFCVLIIKHSQCAYKWLWRTHLGTWFVEKLSDFLLSFLRSALEISNPVCWR